MSSLFASTPTSQETASLFINEKIASARTKIIDWLNECGEGGKAPERCEAIKKIQELIVHSDEELLEEFLENILAYSHDTVQEVRRCVVGFIEEISKTQISFVSRTITVLAGLLRDQSPQVIKRVIQGFAAVYKNFLQWICTLGDISEETDQAWNTICIMKAEIVDMIDHNNDGVRTNAIKFLEGVVILQTYADEDSMKRENDFSLDNIPLTMKIVRRRKLEEEAFSIFEALLKFHAASHISSVNLIACTGTLCTVAKLRPTFLSAVITALKNLHSNLPPTLTDSQMISVRKHLKMQLLNILKQPSAFVMQSTITNILVDLGATNSEIQKAIPKLDKKEQARRAKRAAENADESAAKRIRVEKTERPVRREMEIDQFEVEEQKRRSNKANEAFLMEHLTSKEIVADLVMESMQNLPNEIPAHFLRNYVADPSLTIPQRTQKIAKQLSELMTAERLGPGAVEISKDPPMRIKSSPEEERRILMGIKKDPIRSDSAMSMDDDFEDGSALAEQRKEEATKKLRETIERAKTEHAIIPRLKQKAKSLKLEEITKQLPRAKKESLLVQSVGRILKAEKRCLAGGVTNQRKRILTILAATFTADVRDTILNYIKEDLSNRFDLAEMWLFEEFSLFQGFTRHSYIKSENKPDYAYNKLLGDIISTILATDIEKFDQERFIRRIYMSAPIISEDAFTTLIGSCEVVSLSRCAMEIVRDLAVSRPPKRLRFLNVLLRFSMHENYDLREKAQQNLITIYAQHQLCRDKIEEFALRWLNYLQKETPPNEIFNNDYGRTETAIKWTESLSKICLSLFLNLLQNNDGLLTNLCDIYVKTSSDMKRTILRSIDVTIKKMGAENAQILKMIEDGVKGTETLITRIIYILTERMAISPDLVRRVRDLYQNKVSDVRLLIPIVTGLTKQEVLTMLPKVLRLNPVVVKEVFNRLLAIGPEFEHVKNLPLMPSELLVALHTLDPAKVELKLAVKATSLCLDRKERYTQDVLAIVLNQLVDITPLPTLLMRTILQSLQLYPKLSNFVSNLLQRLIPKQVWKQKVVWEGFLKCCQRLKPASFPVMLSLPPAQLKDALNTCPELRQPLLEHANEVIEKQTIPVSKMIMDVLHGKSEDVFITEVPENLGMIPLENIKKERDDAKSLDTAQQPLPPGE
ncbi:symplekin [Contarinia nasturtii]|uniref:symplekin n=1 Tax=Contarinia nasturtii TaxID=265458 RepID=UPI0012D37939|nr:symplekin [Contarinia nasturtii]